MNWNLLGFNPTFKDFVEKYPNKTLLGIAWSLYWRFIVFIIVLEILIFLCIFLGLALFSK